MNLKLSEELVRIHAHLCGDGGLYKYKTAEKDRKNRADIVYFNNNPKLLSSFREDMNKEFGVKMNLDNKRNRIRVHSLRIADTLLQLSEYGAYTWKIPTLIKNSPRGFKIEWVKAFSHDEGYLPKDREYIRIKSMNFKGLKDVKEMLDEMKITSRLTGPNCDNSFYLNIKKMAELKDFSKEKSRK